MKSERLRAVFFDVGGTLLRPYPSVGALYALVGGRYGFKAEAEEWDRAFRSAWDAAKASGGTLNTAEKRWWRGLVWDALDVLAMGGTDRVREEYFEELFAVFARADAWQLCDGVGSVLTELRDRGLHVGVISNWDARLRPLLNALGLEARFDSITISCEVRAEKPAPEIFHAALNAARVLPSESLHVGDSYEEDFRGAQAVGMRAILVGREGVRGSDCVSVADLKGILKALEL